jgi:imidazolonepropionase-like amidohydrolase
MGCARAPPLTLDRRGGSLDTGRMVATLLTQSRALRRAITVTAFAAAAISAFATRPASRTQPADLVIAGVRVVHGDGRVTGHANVAVRGGAIASVAAVSEARPLTTEPATRTIDGQGRTLFPGLIDAHVSLEPWMPAVGLKYGVTTVRDLQAFQVPDGGRVGDVRDAVRSAIEGGARVLFAPPATEPSLLSTIVSAARARGVPVASEPGATNAIQAAEFGVASIEGLGGIAEAASLDGLRAAHTRDGTTASTMAAILEWHTLPNERLDSVARELAARGVTMVPTIAAYATAASRADAARGRDGTGADVPADVLARWIIAAGMPGESWTMEKAERLRDTLPRLRRAVLVFAVAGGRVVAGSSAGRPFVVPGAGLHLELEQLVECGFSPARALRSATVDAAALLGLGDRIGTIDAGKAADFVLVEGDPLTDIHDARRIVAVVKGGIVAWQR